MTPEEKYRLTLISDSIRGVNYHLPDPEILLFPFLDNLLLLHQKPILFAFWDGKRRVYDTLQDPDFLRRYDVKWEYDSDYCLPIGRSRYRMSLHDFRETKAIGRKMRLAIDKNATKLTAPLLNSEDSKLVLPEVLLDSVGEAVMRRAQATSAKDELSKTEHSRVPRDINYDKVLELLEPMREVLRTVFADSCESKALRVPRNGLVYPNIFTVVRTVPRKLRRREVFAYTAGLLLLPQMRESIREWCTPERLRSGQCCHGRCPLNTEDAETCTALLERPLGQQSRSVSDLVFSSGIVDFGRQAGEVGWDTSDSGDDDDSRRRLVERCLYPSGRNLFYIPLHVSGTPWLAVFTFPPLDESESWHHNYSFYRDLMHKSAELIRVKAHEVYNDLVARTVVRHMKAWVTPSANVIANVNTELRSVAQVYPFPLVEMESDPCGEAKLHVPGRGTFGLNIVANPFFTHDVSWKLGDKAAIYRRCAEALRDFSHTERQIEINATAQSSHLVKNPLRVLASIVAVEGPGRDACMKRQVGKILSLHSTASALASEKNRDGLLREHRSVVSVPDLCKRIGSELRAAISFGSERSVSGNRAKLLRQTDSRSGIKLNHTELSTLRSERVAYFEPQVTALLDGLLMNAVDNAGEDDRIIEVHLRPWKTEDGRIMMRLQFRNTTDECSADLTKLCVRLNSPGPDMVGVSELHWMAELFWNSISPRERIWWKWEDVAERRWIWATALVAEVVQ